jgi:hypothetical protein
MVSIYINSGQPASETWMGMVPSYDDFTSLGLSEHIGHVCLEDWIDGFDGNTGTTLGHSKDIDNLDSIIINKLSQHETHNFHGDSSAT